MTSDQMKQLILDRSNEIFQLLTYLQQNQEISKQNLVRYMQDKKLSSRITSLNLINYLLQEGILIDNKLMNYQSRLKVNTDYPLNSLLSEIMESISEKLEPLQKLSTKTFRSKDIAKSWKPYKEKVKVNV
jgi:hypothetical protein